MTTEEKDKLVRAREQGQAQFDSIKEMVEALQVSGQPPDDEPTERIQEDALSVEVRSDWVAPSAFSETDDKHGFPTLRPAEYQILLCTGGPACRIIGTLNEWLSPETARMEVQDWFMPWTEFRPQVGPDNYDSEPILLAYARCFYFGE